jgi:hypothetical protein
METVDWTVVSHYLRVITRGDDELHARALVLCWWSWRRSGDRYPWTVLARYSVQRARRGQDLPAVRTHRGRRDALDGARRVGDGAGELPAREPSVLADVVQREMWRRLQAVARTPADRQAQVCLRDSCGADAGGLSVTNLCWHRKQWRQDLPTCGPV